MNEKYVKLSDVKKRLNYIFRTYGVSQKMKKYINDGIDRVPYITKSELENIPDVTDLCSKLRDKERIKSAENAPPVMEGGDVR